MFFNFVLIETENAGREERPTGDNPAAVSPQYGTDGDQARLWRGGLRRVHRDGVGVRLRQEGNQACRGQRLLGSGREFFFCFDCVQSIVPVLRPSRLCSFLFLGYKTR